MLSKMLHLSATKSRNRIMNSSCPRPCSVEGVDGVGEAMDKSPPLFSQCGWMGQPMKSALFFPS